MRVKSGYLRVGRVRGASLRLHWSVPLGILLFPGLRIAPGAWLGVVVVLLVHELGHTLAVTMGGGGPSRGGLRLIAIDVLGFGGLCRWQGYPTPRRRVLIAWSGVLAQAVLALTTLATVTVISRTASRPPLPPFAADLVDALLRANLWIILVNLLPIPPFDGAEAWGIVGLFTAARARRRLDTGEARARAALPVRRISPRPPSVRRDGALPHTPEKPRTLDELDDESLPPMPEEVKRVLDRIMAEGRAQHESAKKK